MISPRFGRRVASSLVLVMLLLLAGTLVSTTANAQDDLRSEAIRYIEDNYLPLREKIDARYYETQGNRIAWFSLILLFVLPALGFLGFALYPLFRGQKLRMRAPHASLGAFLKLYTIQGLIVGALLFALGFFLVLLQFWLSALGSVTNPQLALERGTVDYIYENREALVDVSGDFFVAVFNNALTDPEASMLTTILGNASTFRDDPLFNFSVVMFDSLRPLFSNMFILIFTLIVALFLRRLWPDLKRMLQYPADLLMQQGTVHEQNARLPGQTHIMTKREPPMAAMLRAGRRLLWIEVRVVAIFAVVAMALVLLMGVILSIFIYPLVAMLVQLFLAAFALFAIYEGASTVIMISLLLLVLFLGEALLVFTIAFAFLMGSTQGLFRNHFANHTPWKQTLRRLWRQVLRFLSVTGLATVLGVILLIVAGQVLYVAIGDASAEVSYIDVGLVAVPLILLVGFTLGMWLGRGFHRLRGLWRVPA